MTRGKRMFLSVVLPLCALLALPLAGIWSAGLPIWPYLEFPPLTRRVQPAPFAWWAFLIVGGITAGCLILLAVKGRRSGRGHPALRPPARRRFPWWGRLALVCGAAAWLLAWSRLPGMAPLQPHTFTPLWLAYIFVVNALCVRRTGRSPATHRPAFFLALFPASAAFWWLFEYLNRFVQNWYYEGPALDPWSYFAYATLPFATVLPAVVSTQELVSSWAWVRRAFADTRAFDRLRHPCLPWVCMGAAAAGLAGIGRWPNLFFPLVWVAPLAMLAAGRSIMGLPQPLQAFRSRDWTPIVSAMLAALICGFFWELWNYFSLAKWKYAIPYVHRFEVFEMPLLGYAGYLPFGLECALVAGMVEELLGRRKPGASDRVATGRKGLSMR